MGGLRAGASVAIGGSGLTGAAMAVALFNAARARGRSLDLTLFEGDAAPAAPVVLTPECRSRLSALGCRVPPQWCSGALEAVEVAYGRERARLEAPPGGLWVLDHHGQRAPRELLRRALCATASLHGARFVSGRIDRVDHVPSTAPAEPTLVVSSRRPGRFHAVVLATGHGALLGPRFFPSFAGPPTLRAAHARIVSDGPPRLRTARREVATLLLFPAAGVDGLYLLPCGGAVHAVAFGPGVDQAALGYALMVAARDGFLPTSFSVAAVRMSRLAFGASRQLTALGRLAVGPAAMGHPLALGVSQTLATCTRAAAALVEGGVDPRQLARRYAREGVAELIDAATTGARALKWLRRARARAPKVFARAQKSEAHSPSGSGVLGLLSPSPRRVLACARSAGLWESVRSALLTPAPLNVSPVPAEPNLVYVVDDDAEVCQALSRYLEERGAEVVSFSDELALFAAVARRPPAAVVIDVVLSWVDGLRLCEGLKHHPLTCGVRVLVTSGLDRPHVRARALAAGAEAFFPKPIDASVLWAVLTGTCAVDATLKVNRGPTRGALRGFPPAGHPSPS